jgi:energy-coupling factor transporter ATP-binding protein EcfA2
MFDITGGKVQKAKKVVIYGPEGIGKSSLAAQFPNPVFIDTEGSTTELDVKRFPKPSSWEMINQQIKFAIQQGPSVIGTLIIDTIDWAEMKCNESVCSTHNKKGIEDFGYGKGYIYSAEEFGRFLNLLSDVVERGIHAVLTAHSQIVKFEQPDEMGAYDRYQLKLGQKTGSRTAALVKEWADMVLFINYKTFSVAADDTGKKHKAQGGARTMYTQHYPAWDAKNRFGLPAELPMDYQYIAHIFSTAPQQQIAVQQPVQQPVEKPTQEQAPVQQQPQSSEPQAPAPKIESTSINPNIPVQLRDLMQQYGVLEGELQIVVGQRGYFPIDTPVTNYPIDFINGVLVEAWPKVYEMITKNRANQPFN